jgi:carboxylesterase
MIIPFAEPFFIPGGPIGVLLVHGFTGTPKEMRWMGEYLAGKCYSVLAPRLAGHATQIEDLNRVHWSDWLHSVEDGYHLLKGAADKIVIAGLSMGGILSLIFAAKYKVEGVISMSTPYELPSDPRVKLLPLLWRIIPTAPKGESDWQDPTPVTDHVDYPFYPTKAIIQLNTLVAEMQAALPKITAPALLIHSRIDGGVAFENMQKIHTKLGSQDKNTFTVENSGHVIIRDLEKERVFEAVDQFITRICSRSQS